MYKSKAKAKAEKRFECQTCSLPFETRILLDMHNLTERHIDKVGGIAPKPPQFPEYGVWAKANTAASVTSHSVVTRAKRRAVLLANQTSLPILTLAAFLSALLSSPAFCWYRLVLAVTPFFSPPSTRHRAPSLSEARMQERHHIACTHHSRIPQPALV